MKTIKFVENYFYSYLILLWFVYSRSGSAKQCFVATGTFSFLVRCWSFGSIRVDVRNATQISETKKNRKWYEHLLEWHFILSSYFEPRGEDPSRTRFQIDCLSMQMQIHLLQAAARSIVHSYCYQSVDEALQLFSKDERPHLSIYPSTRRIKSIDRCIYHHHCLLRHAAGPGIIPGGCFLLACNAHEYMHV